MAHAMFRAFLFLLVFAAPALANTGGGMAIPEPSDVGLFVLAVVGLILGRSLSRRPPPDDNNGA